VCSNLADALMRARFSSGLKLPFSGTLSNLTSALRLGWGSVCYWDQSAVGPKQSLARDRSKASAGSKPSPIPLRLPPSFQRKAPSGVLETRQHLVDRQIDIVAGNNRAERLRRWVLRGQPRQTHPVVCPEIPRIHQARCFNGSKGVEMRTDTRQRLGPSFAEHRG
jgi:hypothetical protein